MKLAQSILLYVIGGVRVVQAAGSVVTDGTVGPRGSVNGPAFAVPEGSGRLGGNNLFQSFQQFSLNRGESATFSGRSSIRDVITRVTGGQASTIDGTLRSTIGKADMYFINPSGVVFGSGARIDVPAAFHLSTANEVKLRDGGLFSASRPQAALSRTTAHSRKPGWHPGGHFFPLHPTGERSGGTGTRPRRRIGGIS